MSAVKHTLFVTFDLLLSFILLGFGQLGNLLPRRDITPVIPDTPGLRMVESMGLGWNLGCSLESFFEDDTGVGLETTWGNPKTTQQMLDMVKAAGFTCVRIPTTWGNHLIDKAAYTIDPAWMDRVQEVVDYAYSIGLYVILNTHNDDYYGYIPDTEHEAASTAEFTAIWAQIAERFKDYDEKLLFESINEPKVVGSRLEWNGGTISQRKVVDRLNEAFVKTVRTSGGNNASRWLMLPTHAASYERLAMRAMRLPKGDDRLIVSIHAYYPWKFTDSSFPDVKSYGEKEKKATYTMLGRIYDTFVAKGIPVYLGEFGAMDKNNTLDRINWAADYIKAAKHFGMYCAWWDNGLLPHEEYNGASLALLNRRGLEWYQPELVQAMAEAMSN